MLGRFFAVCLLLSALVCRGATLDFPGAEAATTGVYIKDIRDGRVLAEENAAMAMVPASTMKALTTATAIHFLGTDFRFSTVVRLRGRKQGGTWQGDLEIAASADPTLESEQFESNLGFCDSIVDGLRKMGIRSIAGKVRVVAPLKDAGPSPQWEIEDVAWSYGAALYGLNWRDNVFRLWPATGRMKPHVPGLDVILRHSPDGNDLLRGVCSNRLMVWGRDIRNRKWSVVSTMPDPQAVFVSELRERLKSAEISVQGREMTVGKGEDAVLYTHRSPRAASIMRSLMVRSDNMMADGMLRAIAPSDSRKDAIKKEKALWDSLGVSFRYAAILDGSGLARANRIAPATMGAMLEHMAKSRFAADYAAMFPRAGLDGTLKNFMEKTPLRGRLVLKTGSVSAVQCYAGYLLDDKDLPTHVVVVMVNAFYCPRAALRKSISDFLLKTLVKNNE